MKFNLLSDLHLEFADIDLPGGETLLLAGDIIVADYLRYNRTDVKAQLLTMRTRNFFDAASDKYKQVFYIMGNHEHYNGIWDDTYNVLKEFIQPYKNITILENETVDLGEVVLWGGTLWTNMDNCNILTMMNAKRNMNDYHLTLKKYKDALVNLIPDDTVVTHDNSMKNLSEFVMSNKDRKVVVMSHMAPTSKSCHERFGNDILNHAFYSNLSEFILNNTNIKVWVHGHTHDNYDYMVGDTRVICNPRGYARDKNIVGENKSFNINNEFEV